MPSDEEGRKRLRIYRNSPKCFLLGASWSHDPRWDAPRQTHIYVGPFLVTYVHGVKP